MKICYVTGYSGISADRIDIIKQRLRKEILRAVEDGYMHFINGFSEELDLYFVEIIIELRKNYPKMVLEAALWNDNKLAKNGKSFDEILKSCNIERCLIDRYHYILHNSERVIAVCGGSKKSDIRLFINSAISLNRDVYVIFE